MFELVKKNQGNWWHLAVKNGYHIVLRINNSISI